MHGVKRVIAFCIFIVILPATLIIIPLYLRHCVFADVVYQVAESDIIEIRDGISSIFCEQHSLHMNSTFNAFQLQSKPEISSNHKHIRLKKSMTLPDDTLEYWGFYLLKGAIVELKVCSRYDGSRILLVKGDRNLNTCGLLEHNKNKFGAHFAQGSDKVQISYTEAKVTYETHAEVVVSEEDKSLLSPMSVVDKNKKINDNTELKQQNDRNLKIEQKIILDNGNDTNGSIDYKHTAEVNFNNGNISKNIDKYRRRHRTSFEEIQNNKPLSTIDYQNDDEEDDLTRENHGGEDLVEENADKMELLSSAKTIESKTKIVQKSKEQNKINKLVEKKQNLKNIHSDSQNIANVDKTIKNVSISSTETSTIVKIKSHETGKNPFASVNIDDLKINNNNKLNHKRRRRHHIHSQESVKDYEAHLKHIEEEHERKKQEIFNQLYRKRKALLPDHHHHHPEHEYLRQQLRKQYITSHSTTIKNNHNLNKRDTIYDAKIAHGGNALNFTDMESNSVSSFENTLLTCYDGQILLAQSFDPSHLCTGVDYLSTGAHMVARHEVQEDGYYYYIFYSDNDLFRNDIHAVFDIYKPTYQYTNLTDSKGCVNGTNCTFPINFLSDEIVVVEVPTRDGIEHEEDDITYLVSTCHPRMSVYMIFPIAVLVLILSCSFL